MPTWKPQKSPNNRHLGLSHFGRPRVSRDSVRFTDLMLMDQRLLSAFRARRLLGSMRRMEVIAAANVPLAFSGNPAVNSGSSVLFPGMSLRTA